VHDLRRDAPARVAIFSLRFQLWLPSRLAASNASRFPASDALLMIQEPDKHFDERHLALEDLVSSSRH
jgi:hypothetical protein